MYTTINSFNVYHGHFQHQIHLSIICVVNDDGSKYSSIFVNIYLV